ncbi:MULTISPECIES: hypothetical protein [Bacillus]|uniref:Uncharacterized protein n=2 Tax=Bacillus cereus group TaxID=86661 RepID=A0A9X6VWC0_BACCE|nr:MULTISPECIES: hypothetical protein [Bacillus cereus group]PEZ75311.1 hypothetical protein CN410_14655 [Bacillus anthracis]KXY51161.1 hypothetical protein AT268_32185 [Bacillus cereus]MEC3269839.1 hypothetical protein [Bacillus thuringiensis]PES55696.1 hypothetical protein CN515_06730 [Bacillus cereus]PFA29496.1 hypothetical protein CN384_07290 [Bacillus thuringiensis]
MDSRKDYQFTENEFFFLSKVKQHPVLSILLKEKPQVLIQILEKSVQEEIVNKLSEFNYPDYIRKEKLEAIEVPMAKYTRELIEKQEHAIDKLKDGL